MGNLNQTMTVMKIQVLNRAEYQRSPSVNAKPKKFVLNLLRKRKEKEY